jgi:hypothetical protein
VSAAAAVAVAEDAVLLWLASGGSKDGCRAKTTQAAQGQLYAVNAHVRTSH